MVIEFIMDLENKMWHCSGDFDSDNAILEFYIDMEPGKTKFKNFDYDFLLEGSNANTVTIEPDEAELLPKYNNEETIFPFLANRFFVDNLFPDEEYTIKVSCKNRREFFEDEFYFLTPLPEKPHSSWTWDPNKKEWVAPVAPPILIWDEDSQKWILP